METLRGERGSRHRHVADLERIIQGTKRLFEFTSIAAWRAKVAKALDLPLLEARLAVRDLGKELGLHASEGTVNRDRPEDPSMMHAGYKLRKLLGVVVSHCIQGMERLATAKVHPIAHAPLVGLQQQVQQHVRELSLIPYARLLASLTSVAQVKQLRKFGGEDWGLRVSWRLR